MPHENYHLTFKPRSPVITELHSDTLFGHIAWAVRYVFGQTRLEDFLKQYKDGEDAPLLVSDGFRHNHLPKPFFRSLALSRVSAIIEKYTAAKGLAYKPRKLTEVVKALKKQKFLPVEQWRNLQNAVNTERLVEASLGELDWTAILNGKQNRKSKSGVTHVVMYHNTVNRVYHQVIEGLYQQATRFYPDDFAYDVYLRTDSFSEAELKIIFDFIELSGFGRDKSTGKGRFEITVKKGNGLPTISDANAFMVLSHYVPNPEAPTEGFYQFMTKYGRLGGDYAKTAIPGEASLHPFKKPILMMRPGSVFLGQPADSYGLLLGGSEREDALRVHKHSAIRHYACAFPFPVKVKEEDFRL